MEQFYIVKIKVPKSYGACTIDGNDGYGSPLSCADQLQAGTLTTTDEYIKFTDYIGNLTESDVWKCIENVSITTPKLKAGNGVASRATASISFNDFVGDPNPESPALQNTPSLEFQGTYFGKLDERYILTNIDVDIELYETDGFTHTLAQTFKFIAESFKDQGSKKWSLKCKDILYKLDEKKSVFPSDINEELVDAIDATQTTVKITKNNGLSNGDWLESDSTVMVIGDQVAFATSVAASDSTSVTYNVTRPNGDYTKGTGLFTRSYYNSRVAADAGSNVFKGAIFTNRNIAELITSIFVSAGIPISKFNETEISATLDAWIPNNNFNFILYKTETAIDLLNDVCEILEIDIFTDLSTGFIKVTASSPWEVESGELIEGVNFDYGSLKKERLETERYTRASLKYDKRTIVPDEEYFRKVAAAFNSEYENDLLYGEEKVKTLPDTFLLGNSQKDYETAQTSVIRYVNRFGGRLTKYNLTIDNHAYNDLEPMESQVFTIKGDSIQSYSGAANSQRAQITQIKPIYGISTKYLLELITYSAFGGSVGDGAVTVTQLTDISLFLLAASPTTAVERTFIFDGISVYQDTFAQSITTGSFPSGSTVNIVLLNGATLDARGGDGGGGGDNIKGALYDGLAGSDGGTVLFVESGIAVNIYLSGTNTVQSVSYSCDGYLRAPGGGDSGFDAIFGSAGNGGNGGKGNPFGLGGSGGNGVDASNGFDGIDNFTPYGDNGVTSGSNSGGQAGKAISFSGSTVTLFGSNATRYIQGNGDTPIT